MAWPRARYKTAAPRGTWTAADMNGWQDQFVRENGIEGDDLSPVLAAQLGVNQNLGEFGTTRRSFRVYEDVQSTRVGGLIPYVEVDLSPTTVTPGTLYFIFWRFEARATVGPAQAFVSVTSGAGETYMAPREVGIESSEFTPFTSEEFIVASPRLTPAVRFRIQRSSGEFEVRNQQLWVMSNSFYELA